MLKNVNSITSAVLLKKKISVVAECDTWCDTRLMDGGL